MAGLQTGTRSAEPQRKKARRGKHGSKDPPLQGVRSFPRSGPGWDCRGTFDPIDGLAAGERKFLRTCAKLLADGIPPDVAGDILDPVRGPENVVVIAHFPEAAAVRFAKRKGGALFEDADEFAQVRTVVKALGKNVRMVRHQAISMQQERVCGSALKQQSKDALGRGWVSEKRGAAVAADGDEIRLTPEIVFRRKASDSAMERHTTQ